MSVRKNGFVMLSVLVFMQIFTLLGLMAYLSVCLSLKSNAQAWKNLKQKWQATRLLQQIEVTNLGSFCMIVKTPISHLASMSDSWWQQHGCKSGEAYYVIEALDDVSNNQPVIASYYRITLRLLSADNILMQRVVRKVLSIRKVE